ncbi:MAG: hypothetical protein WA981_04175 [Glaciecola sp.]
MNNVKLTTLILCFVLAVFASASAHAQDSSSKKPLQSDQLQKIKTNYENCVFSKGKSLLKYASFREAVDFAPLACRKQLLQSKKYLLDSAFKVDVIDELVSSIEEGVRIDLVNMLITEIEKDEK